MANSRKSEVDESVAANLRRLRLDRGWTLEEACNRLADLGWPTYFTTLSKIETRDRKVSLAEAAALARLYGVKVEELLTSPDDDEMQEDTAAICDLWIAAGARRDAAVARIEKLTAEFQEAEAEFSRVESQLRRHLLDRPGEYAATTQYMLARTGTAYYAAIARLDTALGHPRGQRAPSEMADPTLGQPDGTTQASDAESNFQRVDGE